MHKTYKFRIYPNDTQKIILNKSFGCVRFTYNKYLYKINNKEISSNAYTIINDYKNNLKKEYPFLTEVDPFLITKTIFVLQNTFDKYQKLKNSGNPKYKTKFSKLSYTTKAIHHKNYSNIELDLKMRTIKLPILDIVKSRGYSNIKEINGKIINATVSREPNGKYYTSLLYELPDLLSKKVVPSNIVGIDIGIKKLLTLSDLTSYENNKYIEKYERRIKKCQRNLSRKEKNSKNYIKNKKQLAILYSKLKNARKFYLHKITKEITDEYDIITCEKLLTKKMIMEHKLSKKITDATFSEIIRQLEYKSEFKGKYFFQVDPYYPSSQTCSLCGNVDKKYKSLKEREYKCTKCHNYLDRDINASINIMNQGFDMYLKSYN